MKKGYKGYKGFKLDESVAQAQAKAQEERAMKNAAGVMTNEAFAATDQVFRAACSFAKVPTTGRQAGRYRRQEGPAYARKAAGEALVAKMFVETEAA